MNNKARTELVTIVDAIYNRLAWSVMQRLVGSDIDVEREMKQMRVRAQIELEAWHEDNS